MKTTNVKAENLNYDHYEMNKYDQDIVKVIPGHKELHEKMMEIISDRNKIKRIMKFLDLGIGTGLTAEKIFKLIPKAKLFAVDFSKKMLDGARMKLKSYDVEYILGDYSKIGFGKDLDLVVSVIGMHHQNTEGKKKVFKKVYASLQKGGIFILGDLFTTNDKEQHAYNDAKHFTFMVQNAKDEKSLKEWAHHHKFLNDPAHIEDEMRWLKNVGFKKVKIEYNYLNTALIVAEK